MDTIMKKILSIIALGVAFVFASSCDLSEYNPNEASIPMVFGDENGIAATLAELYIDNLPGLGDAFSADNGHSEYITEAGGLVERFSPSYGPVDRDSWDSNDWKDLRNINYFISAMKDDAVCGVTGATREDFLASGYYLRALWYAKKVIAYGDMPWYDHVLLNGEAAMYKDRESRDYVIGQIFTDLDYAYEHLTSVSPDKTVPDKWCAAFLKMRIALFEASFRKYNNVTTSVNGEAFSKYSIESLYRIAADEAQKIISGGQFKLVSNFRDLFVSNALPKDEVLFGVATSSSILGNQNHYYNWQGERSLVRPFVNTFLMADGTPYTSKSGYETAQFVDEFAGRDPRLAMTVRGPEFKYDNVRTAPDILKDAAPLGYQVRKFCIDGAADGHGDEGTKSNSNSVPVFRYAEVLLAYAEAKAELGEMTDNVWSQTVGALRTRAGITGNLGLPTTVDSYLKANYYPNVDNAVIMEIRRERGVELCLEGTRQDDLIRWGCGKALADIAWTGINFPAMDQPYDINGDGVMDVYFTETGAPNAYAAIEKVVNGSNALKAEKNGAVWQLKFVPTTARFWSDNRKLDVIAKTTIDDYSIHGYTLTQNPGY